MTNHAIGGVGEIADVAIFNEHALAVADVSDMQGLSGGDTSQE
jgi:hypothetical protein